ncbi:MAG: SCO family protein [Bdellovibrionaceae bacterium]|nr:SCO family protein [Pseudobdellovibrionaceae bacterium]MCO5114608.1 SCO family protein [Pseudobdellovibrionaceae bacterium]
MNTSSSQKISIKYILQALGVSAFLAAILVFVMMEVMRGQTEPSYGGDFTLSFRDQPWSFSDHTKKLNVLYIGYAKCPDVCPMSLSVAAQAFQKLSEKELQKVQLVFVSVDHENDTDTEVANYAEQFFSEFVGLSGSEEQLKKTVSQFYSSYLLEKDPSSYLGYSISHTDRLYFLNSKGMVVSTIPNPRDADEVFKMIRAKL